MNRRRSHRRKSVPQPAELHEECRLDVLLRQARRHRRRGEHRRVMLTLKEACFLARDEARLWTLYGVACLRARRQADGVEALNQAVWLRERRKDEKRARVTRRLAELAQAGYAPDALRAA